MIYLSEKKKTSCFQNDFTCLFLKMGKIGKLIFSFFMSVYSSCLVDKYLDQLIKNFARLSGWLHLLGIHQEIEHILRGITLSLQSGVIYAVLPFWN